MEKRGQTWQVVEQFHFHFLFAEESYASTEENKQYGICIFMWRKMNMQNHKRKYN